MSAQDIDKCIDITTGARDTLKISSQKLDLSGRAFHRIIKISRTIADLVGRGEIIKEDILEALQYREKKNPEQ